MEEVHRWAVINVFLCQWQVSKPAVHSSRSTSLPILPLTRPETGFFSPPVSHESWWEPKLNTCAMGGQVWALCPSLSCFHRTWGQRSFLDSIWGTWLTEPSRLPSHAHPNPRPPPNACQVNLEHDSLINTHMLKVVLPRKTVVMITAFKLIKGQMI